MPGANLGHTAASRHLLGGTLFFLPSDLLDPNCKTVTTTQTFPIFVQQCYVSNNKRVTMDAYWMYVGTFEAERVVDLGEIAEVSTFARKNATFPGKSNDAWQT